MNEPEKYAYLFDEVVPWSGRVPPGFVVDFLGTLTAKEFLVWGYGDEFVDGCDLTLPRPRVDNLFIAELWFEYVDWLLAVREARDRFVMVTLGALYGYQVVGGCSALRRLNPMPYKLVAVEPIPENVDRTRRHMRENGIDPDRQWIIEAVISDTNEPAFFPVGSPGLGAQNCINSNEADARRQYCEHIIEQGTVDEALKGLLLNNTTGLQKDIIPGRGAFGEIKLVSAVTLRDILTPLDRVDLLEADLQQSEIIVFPPFRELLKRKVHRLHIGTHGHDVHRRLHEMFAEDGWEIVFSYEPESSFDTAVGSFSTNDGILSVCNPGL